MDRTWNMKTGVFVVLAALPFSTAAVAQRSGQSISVQTGVVVAAQAENL